MTSGFIRIEYSISLKIDVLPTPVSAMSNTASDRRMPKVFWLRGSQGYWIANDEGRLTISSHMSDPTLSPTGEYLGAFHHSDTNTFGSTLFCRYSFASFPCSSFRMRHLPGANNSATFCARS